MENEESIYTPQRTKMVELVKKEGVSDNRVLQAMQEVPRHLFVPKSLSRWAYENKPLSIGNGQTISQPSLVGIMTQLLHLQGNERILEIGTGSGYQTAILSKLAAKVYTVERITTLAKRADRILHALRFNNVTVVIGDGTKGLSAASPFDAIIVTAGSPQIPTPLIEQLEEGGRIVIPVGNRYEDQSLIIGEKINNKLELSTAEPVRFVPLIGEHGWKTN